MVFVRLKKFVYYYYEFISYVRLNRDVSGEEECISFKKVTLKKKNPLGNYYFPSYDLKKLFAESDHFQSLLKALTDHFGGGSRVVSFDPYS